ncbi:hypothetical protein F5Y00DRAFT_268644 [Daldinia vernicosa]|uniref:uncharacterized protein n=1 Tax=Daldinia vernicosa TaxID=114800 RepID=UPI002007F227|nr:uncharacterized protein F5Y00DRAFT_268644 [Daldinia vernicosa]KAI0850192.1 hypothetical protein F5Y00DRAFT_268644 [Daldinia vernicosa]
MDVISQYHGSLIAFEGPQDAISTQLRLLPSSPNILIIPPLQQFMKEKDPDTPFHAQSHILAVHNACSDRAEVARSFLQNSTPRNKRLVFMNGGTASAQMECVSDISKHLTGGDFAKAERIFNRLVRNGASGLQSRYTTNVDLETSQIIPARPQPTDQDGEIASDPASEAMRAADALDLQTASLQPNNEIDLTNATRSRSTSVPTYRVVDDFQNATPFYVFGARKWQGRNTRNSDPPQTPHRSHTATDSRRTTQRALEPAGPQTDELNNQSRSPGSPQSFKLESIPNTPSICEAFAVQVRPSATTTSCKKIKPVDRICSSAIRNQDILRSFPEPPRSRPQSLDVSPGVRQDKLALRSKFTTEIPRPTFSTPNRSIVRRNPPSPLRIQKVPLRPATYVDRGTNPRNNSYVDRGTATDPEPASGISKSDTRGSIFLDIETPAEADPHETYEPILPMVENLVIFFKSEKNDPRLEATIQSFREGRYPISRSPPEPEAERTSLQSSPSSQRDPEPTSPDDERHSRAQHAEVAAAYRMDSDDYDPFAYGKYPKPSRAWHFKPDSNNHRPSSTPPTPAQTPPPAVSKPEKRFHDFATTGCRTAVCVQNSLRSILNIYFPPAEDDAGYHQFNFPLLPELSSLWKPVFREAAADSGTAAVQQKRKRKVDLILGIGAQKGVDREFLGAISGSLEKLGTKPNGVSRTGRLDLRFLIASAMQAFTAQPLANQTQDNPFSNPLLLATLIIPHLETYMAAHSATRFLLLEYPPEHLATVLALQRLVGVDLLKVAGILYSEDASPQPYPGFKVQPRTAAHKRTDSRPTFLRSSTTRSGATLLAPPRSKHRETPSFAKANFLLTSSANESEIATLISTIWKILIDISAFYIPEGMASRASMHVELDARRESHSGSHSRSQGKPLINISQQPASLTNASAIMGFRRQCVGEDDTPAEYNSGIVYADTSPPPPPPKHRSSPSTPTSSLSSAGPTPQSTLQAPLPQPPPPPPPPPSSTKSPQPKPVKSTKGSVSSIRTTWTTRSQRNKLRSILGRGEPDSNGGVHEDKDNDKDEIREWESCWDDEDARLAAEARKYMPLYGRRGGPRKGSSRKALKWLGLAT